MIVFTVLSTGDNTVRPGPCQIYGVELVRAASAELKTYNHASSATNNIFICKTSSQKPTDRAKIPDKGYFLANGIYATLSAGEGIIIWSPR